MLDTPGLPSGFRGELIVATQRLTVDNNILPTCYNLKHAVSRGDRPVNGGGFADIYQGNLKNQLVCVKVPRLYSEKSKIEHVRKVK